MNILQQYLEERHKEKKRDEDFGQPGPVVTISRDFGCSGKFLADKLNQKLNQEKKGDQSKGTWRVVTKEILDESAKELELHPSQIEYVFKYEKRSAIDEILGSLSSKYYKSDRKIRNTIKKVIYTIGMEGNSVILGRCGAVITKDLPRSLHVRLIAPIEWRTEVIRKRFNLTEKKAREYVLDIDKKRAELRNNLAGKEVDDTFFDLLFNTKSFEFDEMVDIIIKALETKEII
ncbi:MAG: cytidylate kinase-like family protein [Bacteroidales bacterium]|nr:cytidylate kinase-like family protein [Bacteroidales bacterium]MBS3776147.1 cytidylate kinase-like family protein [Bacteroidales bacterium]